MTLSPKLGVVGISTLWHFRLPLPIQMFIKVASSPRLIGIGMPSPILWSHPLKMQRIVLLSSLLWWELGTNSLITGPGEWLSFRRFTSKLSWSWSDRTDRPGRGVVIYVRDSISCKRRSDLEVRGLETVWVKVNVKSKNILMGRGEGVYRPPNSNAEYPNLISESAGRSISTNINDVIIIGDFNHSMLSNESNKITLQS